MANRDDYLTEYRQFFEAFAQTVNPNEQLPVKLGSYKFINLEVVGGIIDWTTQYLTEKKCPKQLLSTLIKIIIDEMRKTCQKQPIVCGYIPTEDIYEPLKLMQSVIMKTNEVCLRYLENSTLCTLPSPGPSYNVVTCCAMKNTRRKMEDRHTIINDLNTIFNDQEASPSSYYAIFDGHAGHDAAAYSAAHLHQYLAESRHFVSNPEQALIDAFCKTDALFIEKCKVENFSSGTTAVCALLRPKEKSLYIAWVGDSQALIANQGKILQCVNPHKPFRPDEKERIENEGGMIIYWGTWRVNGQLAVSRAIGDAEYKPFVIAVPEVREIPLSGSEDFIILACDGLWDFLSEEDAAMLVYKMVFDNPDDTESISQRLVQLSKEQGSTDNISVIVVFLREPTKIASDRRNINKQPIAADSVMMDAGLDNATSNNPFTNSNEDIQNRMLGFLMKSNNGTTGADPMCNLDRNGKRSAADEFDDDDDDDDLGPETDVDTLDDVPVKVYEKMDMDVDQKFETELMEMDKSQRREETPTPPADEVLEAGLVDNVGDSGEESEDEWNYFKGGKENINAATTQQQFVSSEISAVSPVVQRVDEEDEEEANNMSQLNPDAAEFVPISPTRNVDSPVCRALVEESILSQSPRRVTKNVDINLPKLNDFVQEAKNRPSGCFSNGHENGHELSSQELMENFLNGKNMEEIEDQPTSTPSKIAASDEFHFGPNAALFSPSRHLFDQSEALSTKATFGGDDSNLSIHSSIIGDSKQETDPMSMSFYQDKDEENPFDLNKVHVLPENLEEYLNQEQTTDLDKAEVCELPKTPEPTMDENLCGDEENICQTTVEVSKSPELCAKSPELSEQDDMLCAKTPEISAKEDLVCSIPEKDDFDCSKSPAFSDKEDLICAKSPAFSDRDEYVKSPEADYLCPMKSPVCELSKSPFSEFDSEAKSPEPELCAMKSPEPEMPKEYETEPIDAAKSPELEMPVSQSPDFEIIDAKFEQKSPEPIICRMQTPELSSEPQFSDLPEAEVCQEAELLDEDESEVSDMLKSMEPELLVMKTPEPELCTFTPAETPDSEPIASPEVELLEASEPEVCAMKSPEPELCEMKSPEPEICEMKSPEPEICEMKSPESEVCEMPQTPELEECAMHSFEPVCDMQNTEPTIGDINLRNPEFSVPESLMFVSKLPESETCEMQSPEMPEVCETPEPAIRVMRTPEPELSAAKSPEPELFAVKTPEPEVCDIKSPEPEPEICELKSPELEERELLKSPEQDVCELKSPEPEVCELKSPEPEVCELKSPEPEVCELKSPELEIKSPEPDVCEMKSPEPEICEMRSPEPEICEMKSPEPEICEMKSPEPEVCEMKSPELEVCEMKSPEPDVCAMKSPEPEVCDLKSPEPQMLEPNLIEDKLPELNAAQSPEPEIIKSPVSDMTIPLDVKSPEEEEKLSPLEDITSSVKDDAEVMSPIDLNYAQELSSAVQENITSEMSSPLESKDFAPKQTELLEDIAVPSVNVSECPLETVEKPAEEAEKPVTEPVANEASIVPEAVGVAAAAVVAATAVAATKTEKDKKPAAKKPSTLTPKKPTAMKTAPTPTRTASTPTKTTPKPPMKATPKSATKTLTSPTKAAAPRTPSTPKLASRTTVGASPKPKTLSTSLSAPKAADKKPLTNGDVKPSLVAKKLTSTTKSASTTTAARPTTTRLSPTKPPTARSSVPAASKPLTATRTTTTAAPKPRPATGLSKTTTTTTRTTTTKTAAPIGATRTAAKTASTTASKTSTTTAAAPRARVPLSKPAAKAPDAEKQNKENVNKATRTTTRTIGSTTATAGKTSTTTVRKTETKTVGNVRSATSKTTTLTSAKIGLKKAPATTKTTTTKTAVSKISPKPKENGLLTNGGVTEEITTTTTTTMITNSDSHELLKDLSPVENIIQDNSQLVDTSSIAAD